MTYLKRIRSLCSTRGRHTAQTTAKPPWWVNLLTDAGRPVVATVVLIMCAPGEHHLGVLAGWDDHLAWGMAFVLAAYAGIAAAVASKRPSGAPGRASAIVGAWLALAAAMSAQFVSHLFSTGHLSAQPHTPLWLVIAVSCVPPLVLGHLLHLAASPVRTDAGEQPEAPLTAQTPVPAPRRALPVVVPAGVSLLPLVGRSEPEETADEQGLLTTRQVAEFFGVKPSTVATWKDRGRITPAVVDPLRGNLYDPAALTTLRAVSA